MTVSLIPETRIFSYALCAVFSFGSIKMRVWRPGLSFSRGGVLKSDGFYQVVDCTHTVYQLCFLALYFPSLALVSCWEDCNQGRSFAGGGRVAPDVPSTSLFSSSGEACLRMLTLCRNLPCNLSGVCVGQDNTGKLCNHALFAPTKCACIDSPASVYHLGTVTVLGLEKSTLDSLKQNMINVPPMMQLDVFRPGLSCLKTRIIFLITKDVVVSLFQEWDFGRCLT